MNRKQHTSCEKDTPSAESEYLTQWIKGDECVRFKKGRITVIFREMRCGRLLLMKHLPLFEENYCWVSSKRVEMKWNKMSKSDQKRVPSAKLIWWWLWTITVEEEVSFSRWPLVQTRVGEEKKRKKMIEGSKNFVEEILASGHLKKGEEMKVKLPLDAGRGEQKHVWQHHHPYDASWENGKTGIFSFIQMWIPISLSLSLLSELLKPEFSYSFSKVYIFVG